MKIVDKINNEDNAKMSAELEAGDDGINDFGQV